MVWISQETGATGSETAPMVTNQASHVLYGYPGSPKVLGRARLGDFWWVCGPKTEILQTNVTGQKMLKNRKKIKKSFFFGTDPQSGCEHPWGPPEVISDLFEKIDF